MDQTLDLDSGARQIRGFIDRLGERRGRVLAFGLIARAAVAAALVWVAVLVAWMLIGRESSAAQTLLTLAGVTASVAVIVLAWRQRPRPAAPAALARLAEDHLPGLEDRLVTAVDVLERRERSSSPLMSMLLADTARRVDDNDVDLVIPQAAVRSAAWRALAAVVALGVVGWLAREPVEHVTRTARLWLFPDRLALEVTPGDARVPPGRRFVVRATTSEAARGLVPEIVVRMEDATRATRMRTEPDGAFTFGVESVPKSFSYQVGVAGQQTREYHVTLLEHPRVGRIDLAYDYPAFAKMAPRTETDGGDIYAPEGSTVTLRITPRTTTAPVREAALVLGDGTRIALSAEGEQFVGVLPITADTAYRVRLRDADGLENIDDPEYFVRRLDDRPPDVRIVRPAGDRQVTPLEEVTIEARADDDHGVERLELVVGVRGATEKAYPIGEGSGLSMTGRHTVYLEDLGVAPGDFVSFYARARDVARGKRSTQSQSDIYFLEVTPFVDEFAMAQSQAMAGASGQQMDDLVKLQKDIIAGTWKLQRRAEGAGTRPVPADVKTLGRAQGAVRRRAEAAARQAQMLSGGGRRGRPAIIGGSSSDPEVPVMMQAARAMGRAETALEAVKPTEALPAEMEALNHLLKAQAEIQRKEIARQQASSGGGGANRNQQDLSALFDRELQRQQETNYETPQSVEERQTEQRDELLDRVRELARRQEALARQQSDLARDRQKMDQQEVRRRLERLTRDQLELRRQAEQLSQQLQQQARQQGQSATGQQRGEPSQGQQSQGQSAGQQAQGRQSGQGQGQGQSPGAAAAAQAGAQALRDASEDMRAAASDLRREAPDAARERASRALDRLQSAERGLQAAGPDEQRRAAGDAQLEARQLAERQRQLADETARAGSGASDDTRRRLAGEQQRLAERADALETRVSQLGASAAGGDRQSQQRLSEAARAFEQGKVGEQMRAVAEGVRRGDGPATAGEPQRALARELDKLADRVGAPAAGDGDREARQISDELAETRGLRERLGDLQRQIEQARRRAEQAAGDDGRQGQQPSAGRQPGRSDQPGEPGQSGESGQPGGAQRPGGERRLAELQREYLEELRQAGELGQRLGQSSPGTGRAMSTPVDQQMVSSAPGTEAFKQDFSRWETLHKEIALGLEKLEAALSQRVVERAARDRLRAGELARVPDAYRGTVDRYYRALAEEPR
jgi:hypothetical protein